MVPTSLSAPGRVNQVQQQSAKYCAGMEKRLVGSAGIQEGSLEEVVQPLDLEGCAGSQLAWKEAPQRGRFWWHLGPQRLLSL